MKHSVSCFWISPWPNTYLQVSIKFASGQGTYKQMLGPRDSWPTWHNKEILAIGAVCMYHVVEIMSVECPKLVGSQSRYQYIVYTAFRFKGLSDTVHSRNQYLTWERSPSAENSSCRRHSPISPPARWARSGRADQSFLRDHQTEKELGEMHATSAYRIFPSINNTESTTFRSRGFLP
jgi:hypothetical protein